MRREPSSCSRSGCWLGGSSDVARSLEGRPPLRQQVGDRRPASESKEERVSMLASEHTPRRCSQLWVQPAVGLDGRRHSRAPRRWRRRPRWRQSGRRPPDVSPPGPPRGLAGGLQASLCRGRWRRAWMIGGSPAAAGSRRTRRAPPPPSLWRSGCCLLSCLRGSGGEARRPSSSPAPLLRQPVRAHPARHHRRTR